MRTPEKSNSESNLRQIADSMESTPITSFVNTRIKRKRSEDILSDFTEFKKEIKDMLSAWMSQQSNERAEISSSLKTIESSLSFLSAQYEDMRKKMEEMERERKKDKECILILENRIEDLQKVQRKNSFEIKNVPKLENETKTSLTNMVTQLSTAINIELYSNDIKDVYRSSNKGDKKPIVVELSSYVQKTNIMNAAKKYNIQNKNNKLNSLHLGLKCNNNPIFLSDHLTPKGNRLFYLARELTKTQNYKFCWTSLGDVLVRKNENSPIIKIISETQIQSLYSTSA